jgi:pSer/pThr/pTyr-binding forkhead associated (FHA) protein
MLETFTKEKMENKYIYIINMNEKTTLRLGRSNESDVRLSDISISRNHACLKVIGDSFYLDDSNSKFGTLVQTSNKLIVIPNKQLSLQIGRFYYNFTMRRTFWAFLSCYE